MALTAARRRNIRKAAEEAVSNLAPGKARDQAFRDCKEILTRLNLGIEDRMDLLEAEMLPVLQAYLPGRAGIVHGASVQILQQVRDVVEVVMKGISGVKGTALRALMVEAVADILPHCYEALVETDRRENVRDRVPLD